MKVTRVNRSAAPDTADRIWIDQVDGRWVWSGAIDVGGAGAFNFSADNFETAKLAEADGIAWARDRGVTDLLVAIDDA